MHWPLLFYMLDTEGKGTLFAAAIPSSLPTSKPWFNEQNDRVDLRPVNISQPYSIWMFMVCGCLGSLLQARSSPVAINQISEYFLLANGLLQPQGRPVDVSKFITRKFPSSCAAAEGSRSTVVPFEVFCSWFV